MAIKIYGPHANYTPPRATSILDQDRVNERNIDTLLKTYERNTPSWKLKKFLRMVAKARSSAMYTRGFSPGKITLHVGDIPSKIFYMMVRVFGPEWRNMPKVRRAFWDRVKKFRINDTTMPMARPEYVGMENYGIPIDPVTKKAI